MEQQFINWLISREYAAGTVQSYSQAIPQISEHYSRETNTQTNIFLITGQEEVSEITRDYSQIGRFSDFGYKQHSRYRNAIARYSDFFVHRNQVDVANENIENIEMHAQEINNSQTNFVYERDLQSTLCTQISELFPSYEIYGEANLGVEFSVDGNRIDVLLEHIETGDLLAVELKSGIADYRVFGQIAMYLGLLQNKFSEKSISGVIVAGAIDDSLRNACAITDKIELKIYRMSIEIENA